MVAKKLNQKLSMIKIIPLKIATEDIEKLEKWGIKV